MEIKINKELIKFDTKRTWTDEDNNDSILQEVFYNGEKVPNFELYTFSPKEPLDGDSQLIFIHTFAANIPGKEYKGYDVTDIHEGDNIKTIVIPVENEDDYAKALQFLCDNKEELYRSNS